MLLCNICSIFPDWASGGNFNCRLVQQLKFSHKMTSHYCHEILHILECNRCCISRPQYKNRGVE